CASGGWLLLLAYW
nr:immunoglobulin heavy chain junction region [Mus musculus]